MSAVDKKSNAEDPENNQEDSSPSPQPEDPSKESNNDTKKKAKDEKESAVKRVIINNRPKQKKLESDPADEGIYLYKPGVELSSLFQFCNQTIKIIIASEYIKKHNPELLKRSIYGTDPYTSNSDAVCILVHSGIININSFNANKRFQGVELSCKVIKPKKNYSGSFKNGLMSRSIKGYSGNSLKPEGAKNLVSLGPIQALERYAANMHIPIGKNRVKPKPRSISNVVPIPETHIVFNMNNQPAYKYSIFNIADKGFEKGEFLVKKLDSFVLYLQTQDQQKYQLLKSKAQPITGTDNDYFDAYRLSKVRHPQRIDNDYFARTKSPLDEDQIEVVYPNLEWEEILWGNVSILIKGERRIEGLRSFKYYKKEKDGK